VRRIRPRLTYANVMATLAVFIGLGGTALASVIISSNSQVAQNTISGHKPPSGKHPNIIAGSINGKDIADRSGVDTCHLPYVKKYGPICAGVDTVEMDWQSAVDHCASEDRRLPSLGEAVALANKHVINGLSSGDAFWTDETYYNGGLRAYRVAYFGDGTYEYGGGDVAGTAQVVCVNDPSA
jgi:hypothetical protein